MSENSAFANLPAVIAEIAEVAGIEAAWALARARGGQHVFIPAEARADHWLTELVGIDAAQKICAFYQVNGSGISVLVPMARLAQVKALVTEAIAAGKSASQAAGFAGVHERTIFRARKKLRTNSNRQGTLF
jgi:hypothetical protein